MATRNLSKLEKIIGKIVKQDRELEVEEVSETPSTAVQPSVYVKALMLRDMADVDTVKTEVKDGNVVILRITPLAKRSTADVKRAIDELCKYVEAIGGDIARLGEERIVVTPVSIRIWRKKPQSPSPEATSI